MKLEMKMALMYKDDYGGTHMHVLAMCSEVDQDDQKTVDPEAMRSSSIVFPILCLSFVA